MRHHARVGLVHAGVTLALSCVAMAAAAQADPGGDWPMAAHDHANTRYSPLGQITPANARSLKLAFSFKLGPGRGQEAAPIVAGATMFIATPFPNTVYALDLSKPGAPLKWRFDPKPDPAAQGAACCDVVNRGVAYADGHVFMNTLDGQAIALDAASGRELWRTRLADIKKGETVTMAPLVVGDRVLVGNSGGEFGVRGWLAALDAASGRELWRAWSTGPDSEVRIGPDFTPHYAADRGADLGVKSWTGQAWQTGGGAVDGWLSYDAQANLVYHGTGSAAPWNPDQRPGDNKWTAGVFARNPANGQARWYYQWNPHDTWAYGGGNENVLLDMPYKGSARKILVHPDRNGYVYVLDRLSGQVLAADPFVAVTTGEGVDFASGKRKINPQKIPRTGQAVRDICPSSAGAKNWQPSAWSPRTKLLYIPHQDLCQDSATYDVSYIPGTPYLGMDNKMQPGPGGSRGALTAWDVAAGRKRWSIAERFPVWSGALATAGDVVFYGTMDGWFKAVDARSGVPLWRFKADSGIVGQPVSYRGPDGKQYVAVLSGVGGWAGAIVSNGLDPRDGTAARGFVNAMKDLPVYTGKGGTLYVFALP